MSSRGDSDDVGWSPLPSAIRRRFLWKFVATVAVVAIVTAAVGLVALGGATATLNGQVGDRMTTTAELQADALDRWLEGHRNTALQIARRPGAKSGDVASVQQHLVTYRFDPDVIGVHYVAANGTVLASTSEGRVGETVAETPVGPALEAGVPVGKTTTVDETYTRQGATVTGLVANAVGGEGYVLLEASLDEPIAGFDPQGREGYTTLHDDEGVVFATSDDTGTVPRSVRRASNAGAALPEGSSGEALGHAPISDTDWVIVRHLPKAAAFGVRSDVTTGIALVTVVPLVLLGGLAVVSGRRTGNALNRLTDKAEAIEAGDLEVDLDRRRADEIGRLTAAFDNMRESLQGQIQEARAARHEADVSRQEAIEMNRYLEATADEYSDILAQCASGDLTVRMEPDGEHDAMDRIATDFNEMMSELEKTTGQLKRFADDVADSAEQVEASTASLRQASEQVAESAQQVSIDAYQQQEHLAEISADMDRVAATLEKHAEKHPELDLEKPLERIRTVASMLADVAEISEETTAEAETVAGAAEEQTAELNEVSQQADTLRQYALPLGEVLGKFKTDADREFYFPSGPGNEEAPDRSNSGD